MENEELKRCMEYIEVLYKEYNSFVYSFFNKKEGILHKKKYKDIVFNMDLPKRFYYKKEHIWAYLNNEEEYEFLEDILRRK